MNTVIASTVVGVCMAIGAATLVFLTAADVRHFPVHSLDASDGRSDESRNRRYSRHLDAMGEVALVPSAETRTYRFLWLRTFHEPIAVRVVRDASGDRLIATQLDRAGGYAPGKVSRRTEIALTPAQADAFEQGLEADGLWTLPVPRQVAGKDGSEWVVEGASTRYRVVRQWSPENGPVRAMGERFLALTGWTLDPKY